MDETTSYGLPKPAQHESGPTFATTFNGKMDAADAAIAAAISTGSNLITLTAAAGGVAQYDCCYILAAGTVGKAKADAASTMWPIGIATAAISAGNAGSIQTAGVITNVGWSWTPGLPVYVSAATAGALTQTAPSTVGQQVQSVGIATSATAIEINVGPLAEVGNPTVTTTDTQTLTNKWIKPRVKTLPYNDATITSAETSDYNTDLADQFIVPTGLSQDTDFGAPAGTPVDGQKILIRILSDATPRALTWNAVFVARGVALPTTTVASKYLYVGFVYNSAASKWDCIASSQEQ